MVSYEFLAVDIGAPHIGAAWIALLFGVYLRIPAGSALAVVVTIIVTHSISIITLLPDTEHSVSADRA